MEIFILFMIAVSLSMDAFSLAIAYGTIGLSKKETNLLSIIVGIYHFFMPIIGMFLGKIILNIIHIKPDLAVFIVLLFIGIQMVIESFKEKEEIKPMSKFELILFGLAVSIDSFSVGIGLNTITHNIVLASTIFSICSFVFTYLGLKLGKKINEIIGKIATTLGGLTLIIIAFIYLFKL